MLHTRIKRCRNFLQYYKFLEKNTFFAQQKNVSKTQIKKLLSINLNIKVAL